MRTASSSRGTLQPKFLRILENIIDADNVGCNLIYSQFRTLEGVGILKLVLEANGFAQFKLKKGGSGMWTIDMAAEDIGKPKVALYTGTEDDEEKSSFATYSIANGSGP